MPNKLTNALFHIVPAAMLFAALGHWPYSYYMLLRAVVTAAAVLLTAFAYQRTKTLVIAAVFNPFVAASPDPRGVVNLNYRGGSVIRWAVCR